jgi:DNA-directed RNA polymerase subunit F
MKKRRETAAGLRREAASLADPSNPVPEMLQLMESLVYEVDEETARKAGAMAVAHMERVKAMPASQLAGMKDEVRHLRDVYNYLVRFGRLPADFAPKAAAEQMIKEQGWDKKRR